MSVPRRSPSILVVDDHPEIGAALRTSLGEAARVTAIHPRDLVSRDLEGNQLVLVDLRIEDWDERDGYPLCCQPQTGLGIASVLRDHLDNSEDAAPVAFALHSGHPEDLCRSMPFEPRKHVLAANNNLDWVFFKEDPGNTLPNQVISLATAVASLPAEWEPNDFRGLRDQAGRLLGLPEENWTDRAWSEVERCHPPLHEISRRSHGVAFLRWLLHRVLPYPCFLFDEARLALRFRVQVADLHEALTFKDSPLSRELQPYRYSGIADDFLGARWWRAGIETFAWNATQGRPFDLRALRDKLAAIVGRELRAQVTLDAVRSLGANLEPAPGVVALSDAIQIQPDDWPAYADPAWTTLELARNEPRLRGLVVAHDREKLEE
jgi:CheY-like chemotaxis protein